MERARCRYVAPPRVELRITVGPPKRIIDMTTGRPPPAGLPNELRVSLGGIEIPIPVWRVGKEWRTPGPSMIHASVVHRTRRDMLVAVLRADAEMQGFEYSSSAVETYVAQGWIPGRNTLDAALWIPLCSEGVFAADDGCEVCGQRLWRAQHHAPRGRSADRKPRWRTARWVR